MQLGKLQLANGEIRVGVRQPTDWSLLEAGVSLTDVLHAGAPEQFAADRQTATRAPLATTLLAPIDRQEVWAAGVTYTRSKQARMDESEGAARFYDLVYEADRPELFFKATAERVVGPGQPVRIRADSKWSVPEPELTLVVNPDGMIVGYTIGNDMSARDIEGENPLYLPQAKVYSQSAALGPVITLRETMPIWTEIDIELVIRRAGQVVFAGSTPASAMHRSPPDLVHWLFKENAFPTGVFLMTGTGIVPPDSFTLHHQDAVTITITGIGALEAEVECG